MLFREIRMESVTGFAYSLLRLAAVAWLVPRQNLLRCRGRSRILQDMFIGLGWFARAGVLRVLAAAARVLLASGLRG